MPAAADPLTPWLAERLGVELIGRSSVGGGCIHSAWCLRLAGGGQLFAKTNQPAALPLLQAEAEGLAALAVAATGQGGGGSDAGDEADLVLPDPLAVDVVGDEGVLVLSWLDLSSGRSSGSRSSGWRALGTALARLHRRSLSVLCCEGDRPGTAFGWPHDNMIGAGPQANGWLQDWGPFFVQRRLRPQLERLAGRAGASGLTGGAGALRGAEELLDRVPAWLQRHGAQPALVHGDLWSGNAALLTGGRGAIFDPAVYRGDREVDLAMARLFGGFPDAFFNGYQAEWPLPVDHLRRVPLYNLYHLLNHANLFGGGYRQQAQAAIDQLLPLIRRQN